MQLSTPYRSDAFDTTMIEQNENIDEAEIAKFEAMAPRWWDKNGDFKALHDINPLRVAYIRTRAELEGRAVLDVGCGGGIHTESLAALGATAIGIDMGNTPLSVAKLHMQKKGLNIDYRQITAEKLAESENGRYDVITCLELLEHVPHPESIIAACQRLLKPGGDLFLASINRTFKSYLFAVIGAEYLLGLLPKGTHAYRRFIKPSELQYWAVKTGLKLQDMTGLHYNPFIRKYSLGGNLKVNYLAHFRRPDTTIAKIASER